MCFVWDVGVLPRLRLAAGDNVLSVESTFYGGDRRLNRGRELRRPWRGNALRQRSLEIRFWRVARVASDRGLRAQHATKCVRRIDTAKYSVVGVAVVVVQDICVLNKPECGGILARQAVVNEGLSRLELSEQVT